MLNYPSRNDGKKSPVQEIKQAARKKTLICLQAACTGWL